MNNDWESVPVIPTGFDAQSMVTKNGVVFPGTAITTPSEAEHGARYECAGKMLIMKSFEHVHG
jgi:hypothetical protein